MVLPICGPPTLSNSVSNIYVTKVLENTVRLMTTVRYLSVIIKSNFPLQGHKRFSCSGNL